MAVPVPAKDGDVNVYNLSGSSAATPIVYFVNGMRVLPREHALTAGYLSLLIEHPVSGIYNKTAGKRLGSLVDLLQCAADFMQNTGARIGSRSNLARTERVSDAKVAEFLETMDDKYVIWNRATRALVREVLTNRQRRQLIVCHSQGNLITSNALFVVEDVLGAQGLSNIRVYSLASPAPAWPLGLRKTEGGGGRQDNAFMNDLVALLRPHNLAKKLGIGGLQNAGDFRKHPGFGPVSLGPHDAHVNIETLNFLKSIRGDLGLPKDLKADFLARAAAIAARALPPPPGR